MCWQIVPVHLLGDMVCPWGVEVARREFSGLRSQMLRRRSSCGQMTPVMWSGPWDVLPSFSVVSSWLAVAKSCEISWIWTRIEIIFCGWWSSGLKVFKHTCLVIGTEVHIILWIYKKKKSWFKEYKTLLCDFLILPPLVNSHYKSFR